VNSQGPSLILTLQNDSVLLWKFNQEKNSFSLLSVFKNPKIIKKNINEQKNEIQNDMNDEITCIKWRPQSLCLFVTLTKNGNCYLWNTQFSKTYSSLFYLDMKPLNELFSSFSYVTWNESNVDFWLVGCF
jgi:WD40 repeat protein